jgi:hypothetical protein
MVDVNANNAQGPQQPPSGCGGGLKILGIGCLIILIIGIGIGIYVVTHIKEWAVRGVCKIAEMAVNETEMTDEEKDGFKQQIRRVKDAYLNNEITNDQVEQIFNNLSESPLIPVAMVKGFEKKYLKPSGLSEEEKKEGGLSLQRLARGIYEKKISSQEADQLAKMISEPDPKKPNETRLKETLTDEEVRKFLKAVKEKVDEADIPVEPYEIDPVEEFKKAIDDVMLKQESGDRNQEAEEK